MNNKFYTLLILLFSTILTFSLNAQVLSGSPAVFIEQGNYLTEFEIVAHSFIKNNSDEAIEVKWERTKNEIPVGWNSLVCDPNNCWAPHIFKNPDPLVIPANGEMLLDVHFQPFEIEGTGLVEICVWAVADSANVNIKMTYSADAFTVDIEDNAIKQIKMYPNPVQDNLTIDLGGNVADVRYIEVYSLIGRKMAHYPIPSSNANRINLVGLPEGMYFVKLLNSSFEQLGTRTFIKD